MEGGQGMGLRISNGKSLIVEERILRFVFVSSLSLRSPGIDSKEPILLANVA
jgi:hypothetical protein